MRIEFNNDELELILYEAFLVKGFEVDKESIRVDSEDYEVKDLKVSANIINK